MMETVEILRQLERNTGRFPRAAVEAAVARREEVVPHLLRILEETIEQATQLEADGDYMAHLYAMFLLAQFREVRAYPLVVRLALLPGEMLHSLCGDFLTESLGQVLASICGGELDGIQSLIENEDADGWARAAALTSLVNLVASGQKSREEIVSYFARLFRGGLARQPSAVWGELVYCAADLYPAELMADIEQAYEEELVDPGCISWADVRRDLAQGKEEALARLARNSSHRLVEDTVREMEWWDCFQHGDRSRPESAPPAPVKEDSIPALMARLNHTLGLALTAPPAPIRPTSRKVGRNEPCPCGSGKKYKKCCGA